MAVTGVLVAATLTGCSSQTEQYCGALEENKQQIKDLAKSAEDQDGDLFGASLEIFGELKAEAPDDVADEWDTLIFAIGSLDGALDDAGITAGEYQLGQRPRGVTEGEMTAIENAAEELRSEPVVVAGDGIEQHAIDVCKTDLTL